MADAARFALRRHLLFRCRFSRYAFSFFAFRRFTFHADAFHSLIRHPQPAIDAVCRRFHCFDSPPLIFRFLPPLPAATALRHWPPLARYITPPLMIRDTPIADIFCRLPILSRISDATLRCAISFFADVFTPRHFDTAFDADSCRHFRRHFRRADFITISRRHAITIFIAISFSRHYEAG